MSTAWVLMQIYTRAKRVAELRCLVFGWSGLKRKQSGWLNRSWLVRIEMQTKWLAKLLVG